MTKQRLVAEFLRTQAAWCLGRAAADPVASARCVAALLDAAAFAAALADDDDDLTALARSGCFGDHAFDPGPDGLSVARSWQYNQALEAGPRDLIRALALSVHVVAHG